MAIRNIVFYPEPLLSRRSEEVRKFNKDIQELIDDMFETMEDAEGIGLAAIQVGVPLRISVINIDEPLVLINPKVTPMEQEMIPSEEGCLSLPGIRAEVPRMQQIKVEANDRDGEKFKLKADGLLAICIQHEVDHMDGKLFINRLSPLGKAKIDEQLRWLIALRQEKNKPIK